MLPIHSPDNKQQTVVHYVYNQIEKSYCFDIDIHVLPFLLNDRSSDKLTILHFIYPFNSIVHLSHRILKLSCHAEYWASVPNKNIVVQLAKLVLFYQFTAL